ncbi:WecB/TagA/CpsF family glycosyltransferase [Pelagibacterales bacterium SAG-MED48]|nr:WecB/TagA/CpsF family glycosyltransferase [Pelagibacterales bacterium SAG-MED48]
MIKEIIFKGIKFKNYNNDEITKILKNKGLFVLPSGPGLSNVNNDKIYLKALQKSDQVLLDSGYFVLLLRIIKNISVNKTSGYIFFKYLLRYLQKKKSKKIISIDPNKKLSKNNNNFLLKRGLDKNRLIHYVAPNYNILKIKDLKLVKLIKKTKPDYIIINIGGGVQEILGYYLKIKFKNRLRIFCTGAAISYFTGDQAPLNKFFDKYYLGWLLRIFYNPKVFLIRYLKAFKLISIVKKAKITVKY